MLSERHQSKNTLRKFKEQKSLTNSTIHELLNPLSIESLLYIMAKSPQKAIKKAISSYITHLRFTESILTGEDLKNMGFPPGRVYKEVLDSLLKARLDGKLKTRDDEISYVRTSFLSGTPDQD